jgi:predicted component of type VI protein secretion system
MNATSYELYLKYGPTPGNVYPLADKGLTIGRDPLSDILINDPEVSRQHALLNRTVTGDYSIRDLGSTNGTYIDGKRLGSEPIILRPSNAITIGGSVTLIFRERGSKVNKVSEQGGGKISAVSKRQKPKSNSPNNIEVRESINPSPNNPEAISQPFENDSDFPQPVTYSKNEDFPIPAPAEISSSRGLSPNLILGVILLLLCSCGSILVFLTYLGGDWFLREIGLVP